ncbi:MAG: hypothetical protein HY827_07915 [Actinobacteria bacterium]|nr:hypothetical protein [Actinomycetota bacterium]
MAEKRQDELTRVLGAAPPAGLKKLPAAERKALTALIEQALERQEVAVHEAEDGLLQHVPRPLRAAVRPFLRGGR